MKKLYTILLSAAVALGASAATEITARNSLSNTNLGPLKTWEEVSKAMRTGENLATTARLKSLPVQPSKITKAPAKTTAAPADIATLCETAFDASYDGMLSSNAGSHTGDATFVYNETYDELDLVLPDYTTNFYVGYANKSLIIYNAVNYGTNTNGKIVLCPISATGAMLTTSNVTVPFNEETGAFDFPDDFAWGLCAVDASSGALNGYYWAAKNFSLEVSQGDYKISATVEDECTSDNKFKITLDWGKDVASVAMMVLPFDTDTQTFGSYIKQIGTAVSEKGTYEIDPVNNNSLGEPMTQSDMACALVATYDAEGNLMKSAHIGLIVVMEGEEGWRTVGDVIYSDQIFSQYYNNMSHSQSAVLQEKEDTPWLLRYVNPYSENKYMHSTDCNHYFIIDAQDKEWVSIPFSTTGTDAGGDGILSFGTCAALGYDKASAQEKDLTAGTMTANKITFPTGSIFLHEQFYDAPGSWSRLNGKIEIVLPVIELKLTIVDENESPVEGATVNVGATSGTTDATGVASLTLPIETGYFANVTATADKDGKTGEQAVALNGASTMAKIKLGSTGAVNSINADADVNAPVEFFNLQGVRVANPTEGQLVIRRQGTKVEKVVLK